MSAEAGILVWIWSATNHTKQNTVFPTIQSRTITKVNQCTSILQVQLDTMKEIMYIDF